MYLGDYIKGATVFVPFNTSGQDGASAPMSTDFTPKVYVDGGTTEETSGLTLVESHDTIVGRNGITVPTTGAAFVPGATFYVAGDSGVIDTKNVSAWLGVFSIQRRTAQKPVVGFAQGAGNVAYIDLPSEASSADDSYAGCVVVARNPSTGAVVSRYRGATYIGASRRFSVDPALPAVVDSNWVVELHVAPPAPVLPRRDDAVEVLLTLAMARGHRVVDDGTNIVVYDTDGTTVLSTQPRTRAGSALNPITAVG